MLHWKQMNWCIILCIEEHFLHIWPWSKITQEWVKKVWHTPTGQEKTENVFHKQGKERNGRETNSKGQRLYSPTPCLHRIFFENVRKRDSKRKSRRGGEKPIMTETVRKVHKHWLNVSVYLFLLSLMVIRTVWHLFRCNHCLVSVFSRNSTISQNRWQSIFDFVLDVVYSWLSKH